MWQKLFVRLRRWHNRSTFLGRQQYRSTLKASWQNEGREVEGRRTPCRKKEKEDGVSASHTVQCFVVPPRSWSVHDKPASEQSSPTHLLFCTLSGMDSPGALLRLWLRRSQPRESCLHRERSPLAAAKKRMCTAVHDSRLAQETLITLITLNPPYRATLDFCFAEGSPSSAATRLRGRHPQVLAPEWGG